MMSCNRILPRLLRSLLSAALLVIVCFLSALSVFAADLPRGGYAIEVRFDDPAPLSAGAELEFGESGEQVLRMQMRLNELGYYSGDRRMNPEIFDEDTLEAVSLFCDRNHIVFDGRTVTPAILKILYSDSAFASGVSGGAGALIRKLRYELTRPVDVFGGSAPAYLLWILAVLLLAVILVLAVRCFVKDPQTTGERSANSGQPSRKLRKGFSSPNTVGIAAMEKLVANGRRLDVQISYGGLVKDLSVLCSPNVTVGREMADIVLSGQDIAVSRSHCDLYFRGEVLMLRDHSSNGTLVNERVIHDSESRINPGEVIRIGSHELTVRY